MDTLQYMLSQRVGIFYKDFEWASRLFDRVVEHYPQECFAERGIRKSKLNMEIDFKDGTTIRFVYASTSARGYCFSKIIMQPDVDEEIIKCIIYPTLKHQNKRIMILQDENDIRFL